MIRSLLAACLLVCVACSSELHVPAPPVDVPPYPPAPPEIPQPEPPPDADEDVPLFPDVVVGKTTRAQVEAAYGNPDQIQETSVPTYVWNQSIGALWLRFDEAGVTSWKLERPRR